MKHKLISLIFVDFFAAILLVSTCWAAVDTTNCEKLKAGTIPLLKTYDINGVNKNPNECINHVEAENAADVITVQVQFAWDKQGCGNGDVLVLSNIGDEGKDVEIKPCSGNTPRSFLTKDGKVTVSLKKKNGDDKHSRGFEISFQTVCGKTIELASGQSHTLMSPDFKDTYLKATCASPTFKATDANEHVFVHVRQALIGKGEASFDCPKYSYEVSEMDYGPTTNGGVVKFCGHVEDLMLMSREKTATFKINGGDDADKEPKKYVVYIKTIKKEQSPGVRSLDALWYTNNRIIQIPCMSSSSPYPVTPNILTMTPGFDVIFNTAASCSSYLSLITGSYMELVASDLELKESPNCEKESLTFYTMQFGALKESFRYCKSEKIKVFYVKSSFVGVSLKANWFTKKKMPTFYSAQVCDVTAPLPSNVVYDNYTPNWPSKMPNGFICMSDYYPANFMKEKVHVNITSMDLEESPGCVNDFLEITYTYKDPETQKDVQIKKGRLCGKIRNKIFAEWGRVTLIMRTNKFQQSIGGKFQFGAKSSTLLKPDSVAVKTVAVLLAFAILRVF